MSQEDLLAKLFEQLMDSDGDKKEPPDADRSDGSEQDDILGGIDIEAIMKMGELMSQMNRQDDSTRLLLALKPHLKPENRQKVDSAMRLMKIMNILPLLRDSGILDGLL
ncbi:MAG: hypothetical protein J1F60_10445 [Oscillospiraceae bacterium]|nr:hypothetical protein [Oscillospiraceae bacterium]